MAIIAIVEAAAHATVVASRAGKHDWSAPYILTSDNPRDDGLTCVDYMESIGRGVGSTFRYGDRVDSGTFCKTIAPTRMTNSVEHWAVVLTYSQLDSASNEDDKPEENPLDWRWDISCGTQFFQVPCWRAWNMDPFPKPGVGVGVGFVRPVETLGPVCNSAGVPYDPPLMRDVPETVLRISGNTVEYWAAIGTVTAGTINQFPLQWSTRLCTMYGFVPQYFQPFCVLCSAVSADYRLDNNVRYWRHTFEFRLRTRADATNPQDGFLETLLDRGNARGTRAGDPDGKGGIISPSDIEEGIADVAPIRDVVGTRVPEPILLNGAGQPLTGVNQIGEGVWFRWRVHPYGVFTYPYLPLDIFGV